MQGHRKAQQQASILRGMPGVMAYNHGFLGAQESVNTLNNHDAHLCPYNALNPRPCHPRLRTCVHAVPRGQPVGGRGLAREDGDGRVQPQHLLHRLRRVLQRLQVIGLRRPPT